MKFSGKIISMALAVVMAFSLTVPAFAADRIENEQTPIIYIRGNGEPLYNAQGERIVLKLKISVSAAMTKMRKTVTAR